MTEAEARTALAAFDADGRLERGIADQRWEPIPVLPVCLAVGFGLTGG